MVINLADIQVTTASDIDYAVIDETRRTSFLLDRLIFDDIVTPGTAGGTLTAGYTRLKTRRAADTRQENTEYPARDADRERFTVNLIPIGGRYNIDRVYAGLGDALTNEVIFQTGETRTAVVAKFNDLFINGIAADFAQPVPQFDGLDKIVTGTSTESFQTGTTPWAFGAINTQAAAAEAELAIRAWINKFYRKPDALLVNDDGQNLLDRIQTYRGLPSMVQDSFGQDIPTFAGIPYLNLGEKDGSAAPIIPTDGSGNTSIYGVCLGIDSVHGFSVKGSDVLKTWLPDFSTAGAVKPGEVELGPVALAAKRTRGVGAFRVDAK